MVKKLVQMFVLVATGAATVKLVDFLKPSLSVPLVAIGALAVGALLLALLEAKYVLPQSDSGIGAYGELALLPGRSAGGQ